MSKMTIKEIEAMFKANAISDEFISEMKADERKRVKVLLNSYYKKLEEIKKMETMYEQMLSYEKNAWSKGYSLVAGVDEVGRGPLAGPVISAAVILPKGEVILGLNDSKKLSEKKREELYVSILEKAVAIGIGEATVEEIDQHNIYEATKIAMLRAIEKLDPQPDYLCLDAMKLAIDLPQDSIIKGDSQSVSIAAASIVAKVTRDRYMKELGEEFPGYGFEKHMGYGTKEHLAGIDALGVNPHHRRTFAPIKDLV